jgi:3-oxoacyl-[acyl-carrier-protein] synthase II
MSTRASELALEQAGLIGDPVLKSGRTGIAYGACAGGAEATMAFGRMGEHRSLRGLTSNTYVQMMSHTGAVNIGLFFGITGRVIPSTSACTSGSQGIGFAYEAIKHGQQDVMIAGGAEELSMGPTAVFDTLFAASRRNDKPTTAPRPFDKHRDGLVIGEGAATLVLEDMEHAKARGARIYAELVGFGTNSDGAHITQPQAETMARVMELALEDAGLPASAVGYVNAHGTATDRGDIAESVATQQVFGKKIPFSSLKGHFGHTLGACGSLEAWLSVRMMLEDWFAPTLNLDELDPACAELDYITGGVRKLKVEHIISNNFAFGGINTSLIFKRA